MIKLRPLIVVTGTIHLEGGGSSKKLDSKRLENASADDDSESSETVIRREVTPDRKRGLSLSVLYARRLRLLRILRTPFGTLIDPMKLGDVKDLLMNATKDIAKFNEETRTCEVANCMVWEPLSGNRKLAVEGWLSHKAANGYRDVLHALLRLQQPEVPAAPATPAAPAAP
jgi:hypothetical protein